MTWRWAIGSARSASSRGEVLNAHGRNGRRRPHADQRGKPPAAPPARVDGEVHSHPADPRLGGVVVAQARPARRGTGERLLDHLLGFMEVPCHQQELADQPWEGTRVELGEVLSSGQVGSGCEIVVTVLHVACLRPVAPARPRGRSTGSTRSACFRSGRAGSGGELSRPGYDQA
jgi:hypothetical protein